MAGALNHRQRLFVAEYAVDPNATQAAIRAGYSEKTAYSIGQENLKKPEIATEIEKAQNERLERLGVKADRVLGELALLGFSNMLDYLSVGLEGDPFVDLSNVTRGQAAAVQEVTVEDFRDGRGDGARDVRRIKFKLADKKAPLELLGKHLKLFTEKVEHTGSGGGPIKLIEVVDAGDSGGDEEGA